MRRAYRHRRDFATYPGPGDHGVYSRLRLDLVSVSLQFPAVCCPIYVVGRGFCFVLIRVNPGTFFGQVHGSRGFREDR